MLAVKCVDSILVTPSCKNFNFKCNIDGKMKCVQPCVNGEMLKPV